MKNCDIDMLIFFVPEPTSVRSSGISYTARNDCDQPQSIVDKCCSGNFCLTAAVYECHVQVKCVQGALLIRCMVEVLLVSTGLGQ